MLVLFAVIFGGIVTGRLLQSRRLAFVSRLIAVIIWALLFLLGLEVGSDPAVVGGMATLGRTAFVIFVFSVAGSIGASWLLWRRIRVRSASGTEGAAANPASAGSVAGRGFGAGGGGCGAEDVSRLVEGAAHVDAHHTGHDRTQQDLGGAAHGVQPVGHSGVDHAHDGIDAAHDRAHDEDTAQRIDEHGTDAVQAGGELFGDLLEELHHITGHEAGQQGGEEAAGDAGGLTGSDAGEVGAVHGQHAACEADGQTRTVGDGHGDEARQNGKHIAEGCAAHRLEEGGQRGIHAEVGGVDAVIVQ